MADDDDEIMSSEGDAFEDADEELDDADVEGEPDEEDLEVEDDAFALEEDTDDAVEDVEVEEDEEDEEEDEAAAAARTRRRKGEEEEEDDDEDLLSPDDVEADLDRILKDRMVAAEDEEDEEDEEETPEDRVEGGDRLQPKRADEILCTSCFLLVRPNAPGCPVGDDQCPIFG